MTHSFSPFTHSLTHPGLHERDQVPAGSSLRDQVQHPQPVPRPFAIGCPTCLSTQLPCLPALCAVKPPSHLPSKISCFVLASPVPLMSSYSHVTCLMRGPPSKHSSDATSWLDPWARGTTPSCASQHTFALYDTDTVTWFPLSLATEHLKNRLHFLPTFLGTWQTADSEIVSWSQLSGVKLRGMEIGGGAWLCK